MKPISIAQRLRPFSHKPGTAIPLPGTSLSVVCYPTLLKFYSLLKQANNTPLFEIPLETEEPIETFTCQLDLENPSIRIWGHSKKGTYFRYRVFVSLESREVIIIKERSRETHKALKISLPAEITLLDNFPLQLERFALGSHRSQSWPEVAQRGQLAEFLPHWLQLGQLLPAISENFKTSDSILSNCLLHYQNQEKTQFWQAVKDLFKVGTTGILSPVKTDDLLWGFSIPPLPEEAVSRLAYFSSCIPLIKKCFVSMENSELKILDRVPEELHCGKMSGIMLSGVGRLDFEWSKKQLRRMVIQMAHDSSLTLYPGKGIKKFRMRNFQSGVEKERVFNTFTLNLRQGAIYGLDHFE